MARAGWGEDRASFAGRAGLSLHVVAGAEDGTRPAWELPYTEFVRLADAVALPDSSWRDLFETAAACDLLVTCLLGGDQAMATDVLADDDTRDVTVALLRWAITGDPAAARHAGVTLAQVPAREECGTARGQLLTSAQRALLRQQAAALARSSSPDAWVGAEILAIFGGAR